MTRVRRIGGAVSRAIDGDVVVLLPTEASLHALTGCGSRVWELIEGEIPVSDIVDRIVEEYDVERERASSEVTGFIDELASRKLVELLPAEQEGTGSGSDG